MKLSTLVALNESEARVKFVQNRYRSKLKTWLGTDDNARYVDRVTDSGIIEDPDKLVSHIYDGVKILQKDFDEGDVKSDVTEYLEWIVKQVLIDRRTFEDLPVIVGDLIFFKSVKQRLDAADRDVNRLNRRQLQDLVRTIQSNEIEKSKRQQDKETDETIKKDIIVVYDGPEGSVKIPKTKSASCYLGRGTRWCTAGINHNQFDYYNEEGPLFVYNFKNGKKWQLHIGNRSIQLADEQDTMMDIVNLIKKPLFKKTANLLEKYISDEGLVHWAIEITQQRNAKVEKTILSNPLARSLDIYDYARRVIKGRWKEGEDKLIQARNISVIELYEKNIVKGQWEEGQKAILDSALDTGDWSKIVEHAKKLGGHWPEGEEALLRLKRFNPSTLWHYSNHLLSSRWIAGEKKLFSMSNYYILEHPWFITNYMEKFNMKRWPEYEEFLKKLAINKNDAPEHSLRIAIRTYSERILKKPHEQAPEIGGDLI